MSISLSEYTKVDVGWGIAPDQTGGAYSGALPRPPAGFKEAASRQEGNGGEGRGGLGEGEDVKGREIGQRGREGKGKVGGIAPWLLVG